jgi:hypothetical protein
MQPITVETTRQVITVPQDRPGAHCVCILGDKNQE